MWLALSFFLFPRAIVIVGVALSHFILETALTFEKSLTSFFNSFFYHLFVSHALFTFAGTTQTYNNNSNCENVAKAHEPKKEPSLLFPPLIVLT